MLSRIFWLIKVKQQTDVIEVYSFHCRLLEVLIATEMIF